MTALHTLGMERHQEINSNGFLFKISVPAKVFIPLGVFPILLHYIL
jgi:hypothetical protein